MGLLSFLTGKKSSSESKKIASLKSQPYNATVASLPPVRGAYPVAGNGPDILETFQKSHPQFSQAQQSPALSESFAPAPIVPRIRDNALERPRTAPAQDKSSGWSIRSGRTDSPAGPPVSLHNAARPAAKRPPYKLLTTEPESELVGFAKPAPPFAHGRSSSIQSGKPAVSTAKRPPYSLSNTESETEPVGYAKPTPSFAHGRPASIRSSESARTKGFVDLLDAQSAISRVDFHHRLQAAGVRDYGEDVADRNMGTNGLDLHTPESRALYATSTNGGAPSSAQTLPRAHVDQDNSFEARSNKRHSTGASLRTRTRSLTTSNYDGSYPTRTSSFVPYPPPVPPIHYVPDIPSKMGPKLASRRKSLHSYVATSPATRLTSNPTSRSREAEPEIDQFPFALASKNEEMIAVSGSNGSVNTDKKSVVSANDKSSAMSRVICVGAVDAVDRENPTHTTKRARRETMAYKPKLRPAQKGSRRMSLQSLQSTNSRQAISQSPRIDMDDSRRYLGSTNDLLGTVNSMAQSPRVASLASFHKCGPESRDGSELENQIRNRSLVSCPDKSTKPFEKEVPIPEHTSNMRHWSLDSETATISSLSSNPFRPQSRHTANTSVDFAPYVKGLNMSYESLASVSYGTAPQSRAQSSQSALVISCMSSVAPSIHRSKPSKDFNIDDYVSSDDDSITPQRPRGEGEEDLLWRDSGYGFCGTMLPGIPRQFDQSSPRPAPPLSPEMSSRTRNFNGMAFAFTQTRDRLQFQMPSYDYHDSDSRPQCGAEDDDSGDDISFDIPLSRPGTADAVRYYQRCASLETTIQEEKEVDKFDISTAMRLRKESKRRSLANGISTPRRSEKSKGKEVVRPPSVATEEFDADVE